MYLHYEEVRCAGLHNCKPARSFFFFSLIGSLVGLAIYNGRRSNIVHDQLAQLQAVQVSRKVLKLSVCHAAEKLAKVALPCGRYPAGRQLSVGSLQVCTFLPPDMLLASCRPLCTGLVNCCRGSQETAGGSAHV